jgi:uncharacterized protein
MTVEMARAAVDYVVANSFKLGEPAVAVSFMGGGEPTQNWDVLQHAVEYARSEAERLLIPASVNLTTNAAVTENQAHSIAENFDFVKVSFDGVRQVQDRQRPLKGGSSYDLARRTLGILSRENVDFLVRLTVTNDSRPYLRESIQHVLEDFTPRTIIINPVYICGSCDERGVDSIAVRPLLKEFEDIQDLGVEYGVDIVMPYDRLSYSTGVKTPYCGFEDGSCFVTSDGYLSACSEIDGLGDPRSSIFFFGEFDRSSNSFVINQEKMDQIYQLGTAPASSCGTCRSELVCAGPCLVRRLGEETAATVSQLRSGLSPVETLREDAERAAVRDDREPVEDPGPARGAVPGWDQQAGADRGRAGAAGHLPNSDQEGSPTQRACVTWAR